MTVVLNKNPIHYSAILVFKLNFWLKYRRIGIIVYQMGEYEDDILRFTKIKRINRYKDIPLILAKIVIFFIPPCPRHG